MTSVWKERKRDSNARTPLSLASLPLPPCIPHTSRAGPAPRNGALIRDNTTGLYITSIQPVQRYRGAAVAELHRAHTRRRYYELESCPAQVKHGMYPSVEADTIYMWARPHPKNAIAEDAVPRPRNWELVCCAGRAMRARWLTHDVLDG